MQAPSCPTNPEPRTNRKCVTIRKQIITEHTLFAACSACIAEPRLSISVAHFVSTLMGVKDSNPSDSAEKQAETAFYWHMMRSPRPPSATRCSDAQTLTTGINPSLIRMLDTHHIASQRSICWLLRRCSQYPTCGEGIVWLRVCDPDNTDNRIDASVGARS